MNAEYSKYVNPQWVSLLNLLQMNVWCQHCYGAELFTEDGNGALGFSSGYCVHDTEHNHSAIIDAIKDELDRGGLAVLLSHVLDLDGQLAHRLFHGLTCGALSIWAMYRDQWKLSTATTCAWPFSNRSPYPQR